MKHKHILAVVCVLLAFVGVYVSAFAAYGPIFQKKGEMVTLTREEYDRLKKFEKMNQLLELVHGLYYEDVDEEKMLEQAAYGLIYGLDDVYSSYYSVKDMESFQEEVEGEFCGIGCSLLANPEDKLITVVRVFDQSPAMKAGILPGDRIVYVNDVNYSAFEINEAVKVMRGKPGDKVKVTVLRDLETIDFEITCAMVNIDYVDYEILPGNIGYLLIYDFMGNAIDLVRDALKSFQEAGIKALIVDLRSNSGGIMDDSIALADLLLPEGCVVSLRLKDGSTQSYTVDQSYYDVPMVVLVNEYSASASEIFVGAVRDYNAGVIVGTKTYGKGVVQYVYMLPDGSGLKVTIGRYYTPSGECIHEVGIEPDYVVELGSEAKLRFGINNISHEEDTQLQKAIELIESGEVT